MSATVKTVSVIAMIPALDGIFRDYGPVLTDAPQYIKDLIKQAEKEEAAKAVVPAEEPPVLPASIKEATFPNAAGLYATDVDGKVFRKSYTVFSMIPGMKRASYVRPRANAIQ